MDHVLRDHAQLSATVLLSSAGSVSPLSPRAWHNNVFFIVALFVADVHPSGHWFACFHLLSRFLFSCFALFAISPLTTVRADTAAAALLHLLR